MNRKTLIAVAGTAVLAFGSARTRSRSTASTA